MDQLAEQIRTELDGYSLPPMIILDITNACNLRCIHCPHAEIQSRADFRPTHLPYEHFERVLIELEAHDQPCLLRFVGDGEPLLHPKLLDMVEQAKARCRCVVNLTSNGTLLTPGRSDRLLDAGIDLIDVSIDAVTKPVYESVRRGASYERLMLNMFHLLRTRNQRRAPTKVMVSFIEQDENFVEKGVFQMFWEPLVDYVMVRQLHSASGQVKQHESRRRNEAPARDRYPCPHLWKRLTVDFLGRIKFCAHDWEEGSVLGNIASSTLREIWQGVALQRLRECHRAGDFSSDSICKECSDWASSKWDWGYERLVDRVVMKKPTFIPCLPPLE